MAVGRLGSRWVRKPRIAGRVYIAVGHSIIKTAARVRGSEAGEQAPSKGSHIHLAELPGCTGGEKELFCME